MCDVGLRPPNRRHSPHELGKVNKPYTPTRVVAGKEGNAVSEVADEVQCANSLGTIAKSSGWNQCSKDKHG